MTEHKHEFIELLDESLRKTLSCGICGYLCTKAVLCDMCQHPFCYECTEEIESCPTKGCDSDLSDLLEITPFFDRILKGLQAKCKNEGCNFTGKYMQVMEHIDNCDFKKEFCHLCEKELFYKDLDDHEQECPEVLVKCPNKCGKNNVEIKILRKNLEQHLQNECKKRVVACRFSKNGCTFEGDFKSYLRHLVDCSFDVPVDKKRKVDETTESDSEEEESAKPLKKRKIFESEDEEEDDDDEEIQEENPNSTEMVVGTPADDEPSEQVMITDEKVIKVERNGGGFIQSFASIFRSASSSALEAFNREESTENELLKNVIENAMS